MIRETSSNQVSLSEFDWPFQNKLDPENRWVKWAQFIPWDLLSDAYHENMNARQGRPALKARIVIGAVIIKHKLVLSDRETIEQIQENPYMQYFIGRESYSSEKPFDASLFVSIRRRMGQEVFQSFTQTIINELEKVKGTGKEEQVDLAEEPPSETTDEQSGTSSEAEIEKEELKGKLILDATVADQSIRYPTDVSLLNEGREFSEQIIDYLHRGLEQKQEGEVEKDTRSKKKKPRTYRQNARRDFLNFAKRRKPTGKTIRKSIKQQLQYLRRNLVHIEELLSHYEEGKPLPLPNWLLRRYWVLVHLKEQQQQMYDEKVNRCDDRIVSIHQPWVRPIVRGKQNKSVEFGAKISVSLDGDGLANVDHFRWDAFNEGQDLIDQVEAYKTRTGSYPEVVMADPIYGTRANRAYLKDKGIRYGGKPLGRPRKETPENSEELKAEKKQRQADYRQRIPIEGKFGQGKAGYRLNEIRAKRSDTSQAWVNSIFLVMNLLVLYALFFWLLFWPSQTVIGAVLELTQRRKNSTRKVRAFHSLK